MLVTSRRPIVPEGGRIVRLDMLPEPQAMALLRKVLDTARPMAEEEAGERAHACGRLPPQRWGPQTKKKSLGPRASVNPIRVTELPLPVSIRVSLPVWLMVRSDRVKPSNRSPSSP